MTAIAATTAQTTAQTTTLGGERGAFIDAMVAAIDWLDSLVFAAVPVFGAEVNWIVVWMAAPMLFLTVYFGFINLTSFRLAGKILRGRFHDPTAPGEVTQFQAMTTALAGTVGLGNIASVAVAISIGGPGATFWMILIGLFAMSLKFAECTLGVKYRTTIEGGSLAGGPMYYLAAGLKDVGRPGLGRFLALAYALLALPTLTQMAQVNQAYRQVAVVTGWDSQAAAWTFGVITAILTAVVIIGGIRSIASVTVRLVPMMALLYVGTALVIILSYLPSVPAAFGIIIDGAFNPDAVAGGILGVIVIGMKRAVYSTEAGLGTSTMVHAVAKTREPVSEGMIALMEPFIDTVVISTMTALVIVLTGTYANPELGDIQMTSAAFGSVISWFPWLLALAVLLFAFSTIISWGFYSGLIWGFLFGHSSLSSGIFKLVFCLCLIPGGVLSVKEVYSLLDSMFFLMAIPNIIGLYFMAPVLKRDIAEYLRRVKSGEIAETPRGMRPAK